MKTFHQLLSVAALLIGSSSLVLAQSSSPASASSSTNCDQHHKHLDNDQRRPVAEGGVWRMF